ncbi:MAG: STAS domain-containing protein [Calditrichaceae bacterium]
MEQVQIDSKFADQRGEIMVVELGGHIDQSNSYQLQKMFDNIIQSGCFKVIVDFGKLYYMSSAGWGVFIGEIKRFRDNGGDIKLANMNSDIYVVFQMLEFYHILEDYASVQEAAKTFDTHQDELNLVTNSSENEVEKDIPQSDKVIDEIEFDDGRKNEEQKKPEFDLVNQKKKHTDIIDFVPGTLENVNLQGSGSEDLSSLNIDKKIKLADLPIYEKVKSIIAQNPLIGVWGIRKVLRHEHFGYTKISVFKLARLLRELDLNTKEKRYRYYRSC